MAVLFALAAVGCSTAAPPATTSATVPPATVPTATSVASAAALVTVAPATQPPIATVPPAATPAADSTVFTLVLADGPKAGTWEVSAPAGAVPICQYLPDLERWIATWLGPPPLSFVDVRGEESDAFILFTFSDEPNELSFVPSGEVTFEADDRGETATLTWVSETNDGDYFDSAGNNQGSVEMGRVDLTIECGTIFRYT